MVDSPAIVAAFLDRYHTDAVDGRTRSLDEYRTLFPGHEDVIERAWRQLEQLASITSDGVAGDGAALSAGAPVGRYTIVRLLGQGGQGAVYLAEDPKLKRRVAIKLLSGLASLTPERRERFRREAEVASRLDHAGICTVYETDTFRGVPFVVMRYVEGDSLADRIAERSGAAAASREEVLEEVRVVEGAARALRAAHEAGVVHRDVKPSNILLTAEGQPVLLDFGLARDLDEDAAALTRTGDVFGTPAYMSPEQVAPERGAVDARTDVYSLGVTLYELLTGVRPFDAATREGLFHAILHQAPPDPRRRAPQVPADLVVVLRTAMEKEPDRRYRSARAFAQDLAAVRASRPIAAVPPSLATRLYRWVRREPIKASAFVAIGLLLLLSSGLGGFLLAQSDALEEGGRELRRRDVMQAVVDAYIGAPNGRLASSQLEALLAEDRSLAVARVLLGLANHAAGRIDVTLALLDDAPVDAASEDDRRALLRLRVGALEALGRAEEADELRGRLATPRGALESFTRGSLALQEGNGPGPARAATPDFEAAVLFAERPIQLYHLSLLRALLLQTRFEETVKLVATIPHLWPDSPIALFWCAMAGQRTDPAWAVVMLRDAVTLKPDYVDAWMVLGQCLERIGDPEGATRAYERGVVLAKESGRRDLWRHHLVRGATLHLSGRNEEAESPLLLAIEQEPRSSMAHSTLGNVLSDLGRHEEALEQLLHAIDIVGDDPNARPDSRERIEQHLAVAREKAPGTN